MGRTAGLLILVALLAFCAPADAATVRVLLVDRDGGALHDMRISLESIESTSGAIDLGLRARRALTGASGRVEFSGVDPGRYRVRVVTHGTEFVSPDDNPLTPPPLLTIDDPAQTVELRLELHRGTALCTRFRADGAWRPLEATLHLFEIESGRRHEVYLDQDVERCTPLFDGRWQARLDAPAGYLLQQVELDGRGGSGFGVEIEARAGSPASFAQWRYSAPARLSGHLAFRGESFGTRVRASLVTPGDWQAQADERGGSRYSVVEAGVDGRTGSYTMDLPDGVWLVAPVADALVGAEPPTTELTLSAGQAGRADFEVWGEAFDRGGFSVLVKIPGDERPPGRVVVELWPLDGALRGEQPLQRKQVSGRFGFAYFHGVDSGDYLVAAAHPDYREQNLEVAGFDPEERDQPDRVLTLRRAAKIDVVFEESGVDPAGAVVTAEREDGERQTIVAESGIVSAAILPGAQVDTTGRAAIRGVYPGSHRLSAAFDDGIVDFEVDGRWSDEPLIEISGDERLLPRARVIPAASVAGSLHCAGGERLPAAVDVRLLPSVDRPSGLLDESWFERVVREDDSLVLDGPQRDRFAIGPLRRTSVLLAVRPAGFDRWTWAFGTENGVEAGSFETEPGRALDLGRIAIDCAPAIRVLPRLQDGAQLPSLERTGSRDETFRISGRVAPIDAEPFRVERAKVDAHPELLMLRELPEGEAVLRISVGHPYFLPFRWIDLDLEATLERGRSVDVILPVEDVGGAFEVADRSGRAAMVRVTDADGVEHRARLAYGRASLTNLPAGTWRVESCVDEACREVVEVWDDVELPRLTTVELPR